MSDKLVLMAVHAHPDDESLSTGGTLAKYADDGVETVLVCATKGEEGEILNPSLDPSVLLDDITQVRMKEFDEACRILNISRVFFLGYRDSGMEGRASNDHPEALRNADLEQATERLVRIIREVRPQVIITYNEKGVYGHPDHIAVNRITVSATRASGDHSRYPQMPWPPWSPKKLYYTAIPRSRLLKMRKIMEERAEEFDFDIEFLSTPDEMITTRIDVSRYIDQKFKAIFSHKSQIGPRSFVSRMSDPFRREALGTEPFVCIMGCEDGNLDIEEDDLFQGIQGKGNTSDQTQGDVV